MPVLTILANLSACNILVVPKCTCGSQPILDLKQFNHYMHVPTFKMSNIRQVQQPMGQADCCFSIYLKNAYLHISIA